MSHSNKPLATLSLDLDNLWSYMKTHGDPGWEQYPSYLDLVVPRVLDLLDKHGLKITFFVVGQDAALEKNRSALARLSAAGHEIGNHSFHHEPWLDLYSRERIEAEIDAAESAIEAATGILTRGFRGPGFSLSSDVLQILARRGYEYDASTFPTFIGPLSRFYYFFHSRLSKEEQEQRSMLFGSAKDGFRPLKPYRWRLDEMSLVELPVTTMPLTRLPFHISYLHYIAGYSRGLAEFYFRIAIRLCRMTRVEPSLLLHPLDFIGRDDLDALQFFPGMSQPCRRKLELVDRMLTIYKETFDVLPLGVYTGRLAKRAPPRMVDPAFKDRGSGATGVRSANKQEA